MVPAPQGLVSREGGLKMSSSPARRGRKAGRRESGQPAVLHSLSGKEVRNSYNQSNSG
jgi:hypothetical protein